MRLLGFVQAITLAVLGVTAGPVRFAQRDAVPSFVLEFAPLSHLWSQESWFPSDIADHLTRVTPQIKFSKLASFVSFQTISTLPDSVFLTSKDPVEDNPSWMFSAQNKPASSGLSGAPATIILVEKDSGILDAFYFHFYSFNEGNSVLGLPFGNHIGDWEHIMVRFVNGKPSFISLSEHAGGAAFTYSALQSTNGRATTFIAGGTHANYATPGDHFHGPLDLLDDRTDAGPVWDVTLNFRGYWFDNATQTFSMADGGGLGGNEQVNEGVGWLDFGGAWGDQQYHVPEHGQYCFLRDCKFSSGPTGPVMKNLGRNAVCQDESDCVILTTIC